MEDIKKMNESAYKEAEKELAADKVEEVKKIMKSILQKMQDEKEKKEKAEESLRILKLELEDLRAGKLDKIRERHEKSKLARECSPLTGGSMLTLAMHSVAPMYANTLAVNTNAWQSATSGTYTITSTSGTNKTYYF